tara:strand:- start:4 stop:879 length:876 start_codon:yes stop_codon:yes gene_type:complete
MGKRKTLLVDEIMATINLNNAMEWLKKRQAISERNRRLFENRPNTLRAGEVATHSMIPASQAWSGYGDRPAKEGGQRLMVRQPQPPASVTVTEKNDGTRTKVTKWEPDKASRLKVTGLQDAPIDKQLHRGPIIKDTMGGRLWPPMTAGRYPSYPDLQSNRSMRAEEIRPRLQVPSPTTPSPIDAIRTRERINRFAPVVGTSPYGRDIRGGSARVPSFQEEGLFRDPVSSGLPTGSAPPSIMSMGMDEFYSWLRRQKQGIADRQERNRINRLMQHPGLFRSRTPYYPTGGRY